MRDIMMFIGLLVMPGLSFAQVQPIRLAEVPTFGDLDALTDSVQIIYTMDFIERERIVTELGKDLNLKVVNLPEESSLMLGFLSSSRPLNMRLDLWSSVMAGTYGQKLSGTRSTLTKETFGSMAAFTLDEATGDMTIYWYHNTRSSNAA